MAAFLFIALKGNSMVPFSNAGLFFVAGTGWAFHTFFSPDAVKRLLAGHFALVASVLALALSILVSESNAQFGGLAPPHALPNQVALLLCMPPLALFLQEPRRMAWVIGLFAALCAWHFVMMPVEAITGEKVSWHPSYVLPRVSGPFRFQAAGLAFAAFYFVGLMQSLFYLAWGPVYEKRVFAGAGIPRGLMLALPVLWIIPVLCVQSRIALFGALMASSVLLISSSRLRHKALWLALPAVLVAAMAFSWYLFASGKSDTGLRLAYMKLYFNASLDWKWLLTGRSDFFDPRMVAPGWQPLYHSHNDLVQVLYAWGLTTVVAYLAFWAALLKLIYSGFIAKKEYWPLAALLSTLPSMFVDLGLHHFEKTVFLILLAAMCVAFVQRDASRRKVAGPVAPQPAPPAAAVPAA
jgi:hypothetical protein